MAAVHSSGGTLSSSADSAGSEEPASKKIKTVVNGGTKWKFLTAWFCPYAQRAWIALNYHRVPYELIEALDLKRTPGQALKDATGYDKHPLLLKHHPSGLVPTIVDVEERQPAVYDSLTCVQFADDLAAAGELPLDVSPPLLPTEPVMRARARMWAEWVDKNLCSPFYSILVPKDVERRKEGFAKLRRGLEKFQENIKGPLFSGEHLSIVDIAAIPWAYRIFTCGIIETYRGPDFALTRVDFERVYDWLEACLALPCVAATLAERTALVDTYKRYADGTAESRVADAVRAGKTASDHD